MKEKPQCKPKLNVFVLTPMHPDAKNIRVFFKRKRIVCDRIRILIKDGKYMKQGELK